jgi:alpha-N-arabinofuranosidase
VILEPGREIPYVLPGPAFMSRTETQVPSTGNFIWRDEFDKPALDRAWMYVRVPKQPWTDLAGHAGQLAIRPLTEGLDTLRNPAFLARRQQHTAFEASTALQVPAEAGTEAGIAAFQNETHWYFLGVRRKGQGMELFLEKSGSEGRRTVAVKTLPASDSLKLKIAGAGADYSFGFDAGNGWQWLKQNEDGTLLSTDVAGGFIGAVVGPHARIAPNEQNGAGK